MTIHENFPTTDYNKIPQKYYFLSIAKNIIKIANLENSEKTILDFGCGQKIFTKLLKNKKIINYDIKPEYSECKNYEDYHFDIIIFNHVLMYMSSKEIELLLNKIKKINPNCELILSLSKQNFISKLAMLLSLNFNAHKKTRSTYKEQIEIFFKKTRIIKKIKNIYAMTDVFYSKFSPDEQ